MPGKGSPSDIGNYNTRYRKESNLSQIQNCEHMTESQLLSLHNSSQNIKIDDASIVKFINDNNESQFDPTIENTLIDFKPED